jgi:hypothetical protein
MSEQVKFQTNENLKPAEILMRLRAQFGDETLSRIQLYNWTDSFKRARREVENMRRLYLLQRKLSSALFGTRKASYSSIF